MPGIEPSFDVNPRVVLRKWVASTSRSFWLPAAGSLSSQNWCVRVTHECIHTAWRHPWLVAHCAGPLINVRQWANTQPWRHRWTCNAHCVNSIWLFASLMTYSCSFNFERKSIKPCHSCFPTSSWVARVSSEESLLAKAPNWNLVFWVLDHTQRWFVIIFFIQAIRLTTTYISDNTAGVTGEKPVFIAP